MKFGPFEIREIDDIEAILKNHDIFYKTYIDEKELQKNEEEFHDSWAHPHWGFNYQARSGYVEIEDSEFHKFSPELLKYGILDPTKPENQKYDNKQIKIEAMQEKKTSFTVDAFRILMSIVFIIAVVAIAKALIGIKDFSPQLFIVVPLLLFGAYICIRLLSVMVKRDR